MVMWLCGRWRRIHRRAAAVAWQKIYSPRGCIVFLHGLHYKWFQFIWRSGRVILNEWHYLKWRLSTDNSAERHIIWIWGRGVGRGTGNDESCLFRDGVWSCVGSCRLKRGAVDGGQSKLESLNVLIDGHKLIRYRWVDGRVYVLKRDQWMMGRMGRERLKSFLIIPNC